MSPQEINIRMKPALESYNQISGADLLTALLNSGLLGVLSVQVFLYYFAFPHDRVYMKCVVYGIYILELIQSILSIYSGFQKFVTSFGHDEVSDRIEMEWLGIPILTAIVAFIVQGFYAYRISILGQSKKVGGVIIALSSIQLGGGIAVGVYTSQKKCYALLDANPKYHDALSASIGTWTAGSVLCDIVIAVCMTYYLSRYDSTIKQTKEILKKTIRLTLETGSLTAIIGIMWFFFAVFPSSPVYYQVPVSITGKVYASSMLVLISSRVILGSEETPPTQVSSAYKGDQSVDIEGRAGPSRRSEPEKV